MGLSKKNSQTARYLRADIPRVAADDRFIAVLADLAASSTPTAARSGLGAAALRVRIAAVTASVALVFVGGAYAVDRFGGDEQTPIGPTRTVDPASPSVPDRPVEGTDEDLAPHSPDHGLGPLPSSGTSNGHQGTTGSPDEDGDGSQPEAPAPQGQTDQDGSEQDGSDPFGSDPDGVATPDDDPGASPDHVGDAESPHVDRDQADTDAQAGDTHQPLPRRDAGGNQEVDAEVHPE